MKVGIVTHYYKSKNYGGLLQAYALCNYINNLGYDCEQITYDYLKKDKPSNSNSFKSIISRCKQKIKNIWINYKGRKINQLIEQRINSIQDFANTKIPHSTQIYDANTLVNSVNDYDVFVVGSDQVWNPNMYFKGFYLDFVHDKRKAKISYAASIAVDNLTNSQKDLFKQTLTDFQGVSVREKQGIALLKDISPVEVEWSLDPTLLLSNSDWDEVASKCLVNENYLFCYFLSEDLKQRELANEYAKRHNLKVVTIPNLNGSYRKCDEHFGDIQLFDVSPADFISLIKYSQIIFTDSFHATVFSGIYKKEYIVFAKDEAKKSTQSRIYNLIELYETKDRYCDTHDKKTIEYIDSLTEIDYDKKLDELEHMREVSKSYLVKNLKIAEDKLKSNN